MEPPSRAEVAEARAAELGAPIWEVESSRLAPMMAERGAADLAARGWIYELKLDGVRILADVRKSAVSLLYRKARDATASYPEVAEALAAWNAHSLVLDGEIVTFDEHGRPSFERLGQRIPYHRAEDVRLARRHVPVVYIVFDVLRVGARDVRGLPLSVRKDILKSIVPGEKRGVVRVLDFFVDDGRPLFELCKREKLEGLIAKRASSPYRAGTRSPDWVKVKCETDDDFVVVGWTKDKNGGLGALDLATYDGDVLVVRGEAGSGIDRRTATRLEERFAKTATDGPTAKGVYERDLTRIHVAPATVVSVRYLSWSESGRLRFPTFRGIREDIDPTDCRAAPEVYAPLDFAAVSAVPTRPPIARQARAPAPQEGNIADFFEAVAPVLLGYLKDRPALLVTPEGGRVVRALAAPETRPSWLRTVAIEQDGRAISAMVLEDRESLRFAAARGASAIEILASRAASIDAPDWVAIRLHTRAADTRDLVYVARALEEILASIGLSSFVKTNGKAGLDVLTPTSAISWESQRALAALLGEMVERQCAGVATTRRSGARGARVYVDTSPNGKLATLLAPYSPCPRDGACVSTPLAWEELTGDVDPAMWTRSKAIARVASQADPMRALLETPCDIAAAVEALRTRLIAR